MRLLYHGDLWAGSTTLQRFEAFGHSPGVTALANNTGHGVNDKASLYSRVRWKLRWPVDSAGENAALIRAATTNRPCTVFIDNSKVIAPSTLRALRDLGVQTLAYYTPDDVIGAHNLTWPLKRSMGEWDVFFTTKTFNVPELRARGVRHPTLIGKAYDPGRHRPMTPAEVGPDYEAFDAVFIGSYEAERCASINALAAAGVGVVVYGSTDGGWRRHHVHPTVELRPSVFNLDYTRAMHHGKVALCFLRKLNRDRITQRTMEIAAMGRPMLAEKTDEHDAHFADGVEYFGFENDTVLVELARILLGDADRRAAAAEAARQRCVVSGYSSDDRARAMLGTIRDLRSSHA